MADSASEVELESDTSSVDGLSARDQQLKCDQLQRRVDLLQHENRVLKTEVETLKLKVRSLTEVNQQLRRNSVSIQAKAEQEEEYISNMLQRRISELKKEKEALALNYEQEEECLTNELNRKLLQLQKEKELLERTLAQEQETQEKLESASAPLSGSSSVQNLASAGGGGGSSAGALGVGPGTCHSASICLATSGVGASNFPAVGPRSSSSCTGSLRGSLRIHPPSAFLSDSPTADGGLPAVEPGSQMDNTSPCLFPASGDATAGAARQMPSQRPRPAQSPMDFESSGVSSIDLGLMVSMSKSEYSLPTPSTRVHRGSHSNSFSAAPGGSGPPVSAALQPSYVPPPPPPPPLDTQSGALYVARLREEVTRLRALVAANQAEHLARSGTYEREERLAAEENLRLRRLLQAEMDRKDALSRQLSGSESSLEMEDERQFNEASRTCLQRGRFRTTSDSLSSPYHPAALFGPGGSLYGPGHAFASAVAAATAASCGSHSDSPRYCRECNQPIPPSLSAGPAVGSVAQPQPSRTGNGQQPPRSAGTTSTPQVLSSSSTGGDGGGSERFAKPVSRPAPSHSACTTPPGAAAMTVQSPSRCGDKVTPHAFDRAKEALDRGTEEDDDFEDDDEDDRCPTPPGSISASVLK
nr:unnamed protein product [Spirometra erinaceieuropaei]